MNPSGRPPGFDFYDPQTAAWYTTNARGQSIYYDQRSGDTFQVINGSRLYQDRETHRPYYLDTTWQRVYYDPPVQQTQPREPAYGQQLASSGNHGQASYGQGPSSVSVNPTHQNDYGRTNIPATIGKSSYFDENTGVQTIYATGPAQSITEPTAWSRGVEASKLVYGSTQTGSTEAPDSSYAMKNSGYFVVGRVFEVLWAEPLGGTSGGNASAITQDNKFEEKYFTKRRRFVVIVRGERHCSALAIFTYDNQGVGKANVKKSDHAMIYDGKLKDKPPEPLQSELARRGENPMRAQRIRLDLNNEARWHPLSRVNLSKTYTIEHNVKVKDIGMIHPRSVDELVNLYWLVIMENAERSDPRYNTKYASAVEAMQRSRSDSATAVSLGGNYAGQRSSGGSYSGFRNSGGSYSGSWPRP